MGNGCCITTRDVLQLAKRAGSVIGGSCSRLQESGWLVGAVAVHDSRFQRYRRLCCNLVDQELLQIEERVANDPLSSGDHTVETTVGGAHGVHRWRVLGTARSGFTRPGSPRTASVHWDLDVPRVGALSSDQV